MSNAGDMATLVNHQREIDELNALWQRRVARIEAAAKRASESYHTNYPCQYSDGYDDAMSEALRIVRGEEE